MSVPASEAWFDFKIRRNRKSFMLASLMLLGILLAVVLALYFFEAHNRAGHLIYLMFSVPALVVQYLLTAQRLRDFGVTGWLSLLWVSIAFMPVPWSGFATLAFLLVLCAVPGTQGENRYGPDPL